MAEEFIIDSKQFQATIQKNKFIKTQSFLCEKNLKEIKINFVDKIMNKLEKRNQMNQNLDKLQKLRSSNKAQAYYLMNHKQQEQRISGTPSHRSKNILENETQDKINSKSIKWKRRNSCNCKNCGIQSTFQQKNKNIFPEFNSKMFKKKQINSIKAKCIRKIKKIIILQRLCFLLPEEQFINILEREILKIEEESKKQQSNISNFNNINPTTKLKTSEISPNISSPINNNNSKNQSLKSLKKISPSYNKDTIIENNTSANSKLDVYKGIFFKNKKQVRSQSQSKKTSIIQEFQKSQIRFKRNFSPNIGDKIGSPKIQFQILSGLKSQTTSLKDNEEGTPKMCEQKKEKMIHYSKSIGMDEQFFEEYFINRQMSISQDYSPSNSQQQSFQNQQQKSAFRIKPYSLSQFRKLNASQNINIQKFKQHKEHELKKFEETKNITYYKFLKPLNKHAIENYVEKQLLIKNSNNSKNLDFEIRNNNYNNSQNAKFVNKASDNSINSNRNNSNNNNNLINNSDRQIAMVSNIHNNQILKSTLSENFRYFKRDLKQQIPQLDYAKFLKRKQLQSQQSRELNYNIKVQEQQNKYIHAIQSLKKINKKDNKIGYSFEVYNNAINKQQFMNEYNKRHNSQTQLQNNDTESQQDSSQLQDNNEKQIIKDYTNTRIYKKYI